MAGHKRGSSLNRCAAVTLTIALRVAAFCKFKLRKNVAADAALCCFATRGAIICPLRLHAAALSKESKAS